MHLGKHVESIDIVKWSGRWKCIYGRFSISRFRAWRRCTPSTYRQACVYLKLFSQLVEFGDHKLAAADLASACLDSTKLSGNLEILALSRSSRLAHLHATCTINCTWIVCSTAHAWFSMPCKNLTYWVLRVICGNDSAIGNNLRILYYVYLSVFFFFDLSCDFVMYFSCVIFVILKFVIHDSMFS